MFMAFFVFDICIFGPDPVGVTTFINLFEICPLYVVVRAIKYYPITSLVSLSRCPNLDCVRLRGY